jgi:hypothetical protein
VAASCRESEVSTGLANLLHTRLGYHDKQNAVALSTLIVFKIFRFFGGDGGIRGRGEEGMESREVTETLKKRRSGGTEDYGGLKVKEVCGGSFKFLKILHDIIYQHSPLILCTSGPPFF